MKLNWLNEDTWVAGPCQDAKGNIVNMASPLAEKFDLTAAAYVVHKKSELDEFHDLVDTLKMLARIYFPNKIKEIEGRVTLYKINDLLTYEEVEKLLSFI